jgi:hypothetical protein
MTKGTRFDVLTSHDRIGVSLARAGNHNRDAVLAAMIVP